MRLLASLSIIALSLSLNVATDAVAAVPSNPADRQATTQLPRTARPSHYDVTLIPDAQNMRFSGKVRIDLDILTATDTIVLNAADLTFSHAALEGAGNLPAPVIRLDEQAQTASFTFARKLAPGHYTLALDYDGRIYTQAAGLFALDYDSDQGRMRALYTQFENSDARRVIPSWDEPAYKATFSLKAIVPSAQMAVSNMPVAARADAGQGRTLVTFGQSPKMSTYLLFFGLGDFDRATRRIGATEVGVITKKGDVDKAGFALESAAEILPWYNDYFATPYPLPKLDNIAAPGRSQFFSAMENWGAIFTFEGSLLFDPVISTETDKQRIFITAAHEMAHQWFGDLVTMRWWDDLWLNEGFASWMEGRATEHFHPEWDAQLDAVGNRDRAMALDALASTHPVVQHVETVDQASQAFDAITYQKGEAVIRMLEAYTGSDAWRDGVRRYIHAHAHGNTVTDDLWSAIEQAAGKPITTIAHDFTLQPGIPLIRVEQAQCTGGSTRLSLTQSEFALDRAKKKPLSWHVPVIARAIDQEDAASTIVSNGRGTLDVKGCSPVVVNAGQSGYYRTLYAPRLFTALKDDFAAMAPADQLGLMADSAALGLAGQQPAPDVLALIKAIPADARPHVWSSATEILLNLYDYADGDTPVQDRLRHFAIARLRPVLDNLGWTPRAGEADTAAILRGRLIAVLGDMGDPKVVAEARSRFARRNSDATALPGPLRRTIVGVVATHADTATWDALHADAAAEKSALVKAQLYTLLGAARDPALARRALELALTDEPGETNSAAMIARVGYEHPELAFDFAVANKAQVERKVDTASRNRFVPRIASFSHDPAMIEKLKAYARDNIPAEARRSVDTALASIATRIQVRQSRLPEIARWLAKNGG